MPDTKAPGTGLDTADYFYELPKELIAQDPIPDRSSSRLLVMDRSTGAVTHRVFRDVKEYLRPGDCLVLNDTKVIPARLLGTRSDTGANVEILLLKRLADNGDEVIQSGPRDSENTCEWECLVKPGKKLRPGSRVHFGAGDPTDAPLRAEILEVKDDGNRIARFYFDGIWEEVLDALGEMPLPPYITHKLPREERDRYQTVYARNTGSAAAPTAGLHFTDTLLDEIRSEGVKTVFVTLHVGLGTFRPVKTTDIREHHMHTEWCQISGEAADAINTAKAQGGRVICVGTTSVRTLETMSEADGTVRAGSADTSIFIYPGYTFKAVDGLITNFHLPESTLIMLVSAFAGRERVLEAYREAVRERYRFFSFGDAMLIL